MSSVPSAPNAASNPRRTVPAAVAEEFSAFDELGDRGGDHGFPGRVATTDKFQQIAVVDLEIVGIDALQVFDEIVDPQILMQGFQVVRDEHVLECYEWTVF